ncbi:hypothetical protein N7493_007338 [Penicillium malachiteum]|uniref:Uncharacterized protein n=1 Tax=Penicillium malachiteum TaxID=1324776 RepID=A0AAD6HJ15_9EURO|nr:hypothetical protein N7493_007338 [Penicillium malachiteum]
MVVDAGVDRARDTELQRIAKEEPDGDYYERYRSTCPPANVVSGAEYYRIEAMGTPNQRMEDPPPISSLGMAIDRIEVLEKKIQEKQEEVREMWRTDKYMQGIYEGWPEIGLADWDSAISIHVNTILGWGLSYAFKARRSTYEHLSKEAKKEIISSLEGWIVQDDFDKTVARFPPAIRYRVLAFFAAMRIFKDGLRLFFQNPFWYFQTDGEFENDDDESHIESAFGAQLNTLYQQFNIGDFPFHHLLAHHWRAQTVRLANSRSIGCLRVRRDDKLGMSNKALQEKKAHEHAAAMLKDKTFRYLLREPKDEQDAEDMQSTLAYMYTRMAGLARGITTGQTGLHWKLLDGVPKNFFLSSKDVTVVRHHRLRSSSLALNGREVLAILSPLFFRSGSFDRDHKYDTTAIPAQVIVEDRYGNMDAVFSSDEDAYPRKRRNKTRTAKSSRPLPPYWR